MGLGPTAKACLVLCAVGLAFIIPVSILVVAPMIGQHALNVAVMNIPNATVFGLPDNLHTDHVASIFNLVHLKQSFFPLPSKLHETTFAMHVPASPPGSGFVWPETNMAWFTLPEQDIKHGDNTFQFSADFTVIENTDYFTYWAFSLVFSPPPAYTTLQIVGRPTLSALGGIFRMGLQMGKTLNCTYIPVPFTDEGVKDADAIESLMATQRLQVQVRGLGPVTLECADQGEMDRDLIEAVLQNFTDDLARTTTTTTTPTTTTGTTTTAPPTSRAPTTTAPPKTMPTTAMTTTIGVGALDSKKDLYV
jgi:hypothetical protein